MAVRPPGEVAGCGVVPAGPGERIASAIWPLRLAEMAEIVSRHRREPILRAVVPAESDPGRITPNRALPKVVE